MSLFILIFISAYSSMHAFFYYRARVLLPYGGAVRVFSILFLVLMVFAPIITRLLERNGCDFAARLMAYIGYAWMGFLFISFCGLLLLFAANLALKGLHCVAGISVLDLAGRGITAAVLVLAGLTCIYGFFEARSIRVERVVVKTTKLPAGVNHLKIAQISDVHLGLLVGNERLKSILDKVRIERPDILVCTGDLVDGNIDRMDQINVAINEINPRYGKFAVTGNHEYYAGLDRSIKFLQTFGFEVLRGETRNVENIIRIAGVDDPAGGVSVEEASLLSSGSNTLFTLFLKHRPQVDIKTLGLFDLQLSGHTHRGQIFPFRFFTGMVYPMQNGFHELGKGSSLYTSRGSGTWGPPVRVLSPPEVTMIELVRD